MSLIAFYSSWSIEKKMFRIKIIKWRVNGNHVVLVCRSLLCFISHILFFGVFFFQKFVRFMWIMNESMRDPFILLSSLKYRFFFVSLFSSSSPLLLTIWLVRLCSCVCRKHFFFHHLLCLLKSDRAYVDVQMYRR